MQIKTTMRDHLTRVRLAVIKKKKKSLQIKNAGEGVEKREPSYTIDGNVNCTATMVNSMEVPQKTKYRTTI